MHNLRHLGSLHLRDGMYRLLIIDRNLWSLVSLAHIMTLTMF